MPLENRPAIEESKSTKNILDRDFDEVRKREQSAEPFGRKILTGVATKADIFKWYKSQDPIGENLMRSALNPSVESIRVASEFYLTNSRIYEKAAEIYLEESGLTTSGVNLMPDIALKLQTGNLNADQLADLLFGVDMLSSSGRDADLARDYGRIEFLSMSDETLVETVNRINITNTTMNSFLEQIYTGIKNNPAITERRILEYGAKAFIMHLCNLGFDESNPAFAHEGRKAFISAGIEYLNEFLLERGLVDKWRDSGQSGKLLELLWVFDAYFYLTMQGRDFAQVVPALDNQDRPFADPKMPKKQYLHKRAVDVLVYDRFKGLSYFVQLGQKGKRNGSHACILTVRENNFMDDDRNKLVAKLAAYSKAEDSDFSQTASNEAMKYVLKTVPDVYSEKYAKTDCNMFREALGIMPDVDVARNLVSLDPLAIPVGSLPLVVQEQLRKKGLLSIGDQKNLDLDFDFEVE